MRLEAESAGQQEVSQGLKQREQRNVLNLALSTLCNAVPVGLNRLVARQQQ
jgi:hypothetical protein